MRLLPRAATALVIFVATVVATAAVLAVTKDWLVALGLCVGVAERGQSPLEASIYINKSGFRFDCSRSCDGRFPSIRSRSLASPCG